MRLRFALCVLLLATPALANSRLNVIAETSQAAGDAGALVKALLAGLAGEHAGCPVYLDANGDLPVTVGHVPGPPPGWTVVLGSADIPAFKAEGVAGDLSAAAAGILETLCPKRGDAAATGPWTAQGGNTNGESIVITGTVQDLLAPFTLEGVFPGGQAVFTYTPVNIGGGAVDYTLSGSGVTGQGDGLYSLKALPDGVYVLEQTTEGCVDGIPGSCRTNSDTITLTPITE